MSANEIQERIWDLKSEMQCLTGAARDQVRAEINRLQAILDSM